VSSGAALVTGSSGGIGRGILLELARRGYDVAVHYRSSFEAAERTRLRAEELGVRAVVLQGDLTDLDRAEGIVGETRDALGSLDVLVNNVGNYVLKPLVETTHDDWRDVMGTNLDAVFATCRAAVPLMRARGRGRIVNIGYAGALNIVARPSLVPYAIAKTGIVVLSRSLARSEAVHGITVNVVAPGVIENSTSIPLQELPMGRVGRIAEVAAAVGYLVSAEADYVTGQVIEVAGGWNL
jgi:NAD(P)-dependent dehydrogenase (short-subunit alcohol dehydrogenase family)